jgi:hypothetical protein
VSEGFVKITNKLGLPAAFHRAVEADPYTKGDSDFSATGLANPARATVLIEQAGDALEVDCAGRVAATIGQGAHSILERAARPDIDVIEKRYFADFVVDGVTYVVSAQIDIYETDTGVLSDWKTTKAYAFSKKTGGGKKPEWLQQMNVAAEIMARQAEPIVVKALQIVGLLKDWDKRKSQSETGYPPTEVMTVEIPLWEREKTVRYIEERIRAHVAARVELPQCSTKETWGGNRCGQWCDASSVCEQYKEMIKTGLTKQEEPA